MPPVGVAQPLDALDGGRLPGAVGPEDAEDLASLDLERHVVDRHDVVAVDLSQVFHGDDRRHARELTRRRYDPAEADASARS